MDHPNFDPNYLHPTYSSSLYPPTPPPSSYNPTPYTTPPITAPTTAATSPEYQYLPLPHSSSSSFIFTPYQSEGARAATAGQFTGIMSSSSSNNNNNMHHQSHPHLFPEQIQSGTGSGTTGPSSYRASTSTQQQQQHLPLPSNSNAYGTSSQTGPALQVAHPSASSGVDIFRHRSASPWIPPQQQHHNILEAYSGGNTTEHSNNNAALTLFNASSYGTHHPLSQSQHNPHEYNLPTSQYSGGNGGPHDTYPSPHQGHANLPYGYPMHSYPALPPSHNTHSGGSPASSLLDKHLNRAGGQQHQLPYYTEQNFNNNNKYLPHIKQEQDISRSRGSGKSGALQLQQQQHRSASNGTRANSAENNDGSNAAGATAAGQNNYGIIDETNTTLWDLRDGPDGPSGKPPYPYLTIIRIALLSSETGKLTLQELYDALESRYPFFKGDQKGWKNSIRHNLSLNKCFKKETRHVLDPGKGSYWYCDLNEEHSTPRVRQRRDGTSAGVSGSKGNASKSSKKRKAESPNSGDAEGSDAPYHPDYNNSNNNYPFEGIRSIKVRVGDLKLPFNLAGPSNSAVGGGGHLHKRQRAVSAPSPITPNFLASFTNSTSGHGAGAFGGGGHEAAVAGAAPFGMTGLVQGHSYGANLQPYAFPQIFNQPTQVAKYEFPAFPTRTTTTTGEGSGNNHQFGISSNNTMHHHQLPPMPSLISDTAPHSGATDSTFALETPRTIYSGANASGRPGTANSINHGSTDVKPNMSNLEGGTTVKEEDTSFSDLNHLGTATDGGLGISGGEIHGGGGGGGAKAEEVTPGPAPAYVFPATQKASDDPRQTKRVFVNPHPGINNSSPQQQHQHLQQQHQHQQQSQHRLHGGVQGNVAAENLNAILNSSLPLTSMNASTSSSSSGNPFILPTPSSAEESRSRPAPLNINDKQGKNLFSPPSATSPSRHLPTEFDTMFSNAPFGIVFDNPPSASSKGSGRKGSFFSGLTAR